MNYCRVIGVLIGISVIACGGDGGGTGGTGGDGGANPAIDTVFPADNAIGTWVIDDVHGDGGANPLTNPAGVEVAETNTELVALINGGADPFTDRNFVQFGREYYTDGTYEAIVWIFEMPDTAVATDLYENLFTLALYDYMTDSVTAGDAARAGNNGLVWNYHARKDEYFFLVENVLNDAGGLTAGTLLLSGIADGL